MSCLWTDIPLECISAVIAGLFVKSTHSPVPYPSRNIFNANLAQSVASPQRAAFKLFFCSGDLKHKTTFSDLILSEKGSKFQISDTPKGSLQIPGSDFQVYAAAAAAFWAAVWIVESSLTPSRKEAFSPT